MPAEICRRCRAVEECYEFMLAFAAQGVSSADGSRSGGRIREVLQQAVAALSGLTDACRAAASADASDSAALVLAQPAISSRLIDNLNASMHLRALLTDLFLVSDIARIARTSPAASAVAG